MRLGVTDAWAEFLQEANSIFETDSLAPKNVTNISEFYLTSKTWSASKLFRLPINSLDPLYTSYPFTYTPNKTP